MKHNTYKIYFVASDDTENYQRVSAFNLRDALIIASARQLESGKDCNFYKAFKMTNNGFVICFDYGIEDATSLTY